MKPKNRNDGGTSYFSLHVDATTSILKAEPFECNLSFYPETRMKDFLEHATLSTLHDKKTPLATLAFVVINVDDASGSKKSSLDLLTIADGPSAHDRGSVSCSVCLFPFFDAQLSLTLSLFLPVVFCE